MTTAFEAFVGSTWSSAFPETKTVEQWTSILRLATKWTFTSLRELAVQHLFDITSPVEKIVLGKTFDLPEWLPQAYADLCKREKPLTIDEGRNLFQLGAIGCDIVIQLNQASHRWRNLQESCLGYTMNTDIQVAQIVNTVFQLTPAAPETTMSHDGEELIDNHAVSLADSGEESQPPKKGSKIGITGKKQIKKKKK